jgi:hypothetical protein
VGFSASFDTHALAVISGGYTISFAYAGDTNYAAATGSSTLTVTQATLTATGVAPLAAGLASPFSGILATFANADPFGTPASYSAAITWGDGVTSPGIIIDEGGGIFAVSGSHTYLSAGTDAITVQIDHTLGNTTSATANDTATVTSDMVLSGTSGNDSLEVMRTAGGAPGDVTYILDGGAPVSLHGVTSFTFNAGAGNDTMTVNLVNGAPLVNNGAVTLDGGTGTNTLNLDAAGLPVHIGPGQFSGAGQAVTFRNVTITHVNDAGAINTFAGPDTADRTTAFAGLTPQERFVQALYLDELGRAGAKAELDSWVNALNTPGMSQATVAAGIEHSPEARDHLVRSWYWAFLGRQAAGGEEMGWVNQLLAGQTEEQVLSGILGSAEFYARSQTLVGSGSADERYVQALYQVLLGRRGEAAGVAAWAQALPSIGARGEALGFLSSTEYRTDLADAYYSALLHRPADAGLSGWVSSGLDAGAMRAGFESSPEFFANG